MTTAEQQTPVPVSGITIARNTQPGPTVYSDGGQKDAVVEWKGAGDLMGEDSQPVPDAVVNSVQFQRAVARGIFVIESAPERVQEVLQLHKQQWQQRQEHARAAAQQSLDALPQNDLLMLPCIAPTGAGTTCSSQVPVRARARNEAPPLCGLHTSLAPRFIAQTGEKLIDGKPEVTWVMSQMGQTERQQQ
jgi:hypothetical protein